MVIKIEMFAQDIARRRARKHKLSESLNGRLETKGDKLESENKNVHRRRDNITNINSTSFCGDANGDWNAEIF